jgi:hypothetical protein|tara:strand:- start:2147 stop:2374 length:228 start_codon:yes stop_codon:yes gene_type:complete
MKTLMMITILVVMTTMMTKADETIDTKVKNFVVSEWVEVKEYQKAQWQSGNEQVIDTWTKLKNFIWKVGNNVTQN